MTQRKAGTYSGPDTKEGWPVFDPQSSHFLNLYRYVESQVNWKPSSSIKRLGSNSEANRYEGAPFNKDTGEEIPRDISSGMNLYRIDPKPTPAPTPATCPLPKKRKSKRKALENKTNTKSKKSTGKKK